MELCATDAGSSAIDCGNAGLSRSLGYDNLVDGPPMLYPVDVSGFNRLWPSGKVDGWLADYDEISSARISRKIANVFANDSL